MFRCLNILFGKRPVRSELSTRLSFSPGIGKRTKSHCSLVQAPHASSPTSHACSASLGSPLSYQVSKVYFVQDELDSFLDVEVGGLITRITFVKGQVFVLSMVRCGASGEVSLVPSHERYVSVEAVVRHDRLTTPSRVSYFLVAK